jgi:succinate dehydrogenase / fumarate reductase flavoprotein subunit
VPRYLETVGEVKGTKIFSAAVAHEEAFKHDLLSRNGPENVHKLHDEMAEWMILYMTVKRDNTDLKKTIDKLKELRERYGHISLDDRGNLMNQTYAFANQFSAMLELALAMTKSALMRNESRGSHFKLDYPTRNDAEWLKTTIATYHKNEPVISYKKVDLRHLEPISRDYVHAKKIKPTLSNIPNNIQLPL